VNDQYDNEKTDKEMLEREKQRVHETVPEMARRMYATFREETGSPLQWDELEERTKLAWEATAAQVQAQSKLSPITREWMVNLLAKVPSTTVDELVGAGFPPEVVDEWGRMWSRPPIGKVHVATAREYRSNCKMMFFPSHEAVNEWFEKNIGYIMFDWKINVDGGICAIIGQVLAPEEQEDLDIRAAVIDEMVRERKEERKRHIEEHVAKLRAEQEENRRLIEKGRRCERHHGKFIEEGRKARKEKK